jgi:hypothetical protein
VISETVIMGCEGVPKEMRRFDRPWHFVGEVEGCRSHWEILCQRCCPKMTELAQWLNWAEPGVLTYHRVSLRGYPLVTDDRIEVMVYFGVCGGCDSIYWALQGPPFTRARCLVVMES